MKRTPCLIFAFLLISEFSFSQPRRTLRVKAGEDMAQAYSKQGFYRFPQFIPGTVFFNDGSQNKGTKFNYNILDGTMQFISNTGDTLNMSKNNNTDSVVFSEVVYYCKSDDFLEVVTTGKSSVRLLKKIFIKKQIENIGAYGQANSTASIDNIKNFYFGTNVFSFIINQDIVLIENVTWFFAGPGNQIERTGKSSFLKLIPTEKQNEASEFIKKNKINFDREEDLKKLLGAFG